MYTGAKLLADGHILPQVVKRASLRGKDSFGIKVLRAWNEALRSVNAASEQS